MKFEIWLVIWRLLLTEKEKHIDPHQRFLVILIGLAVAVSNPVLAQTELEYPTRPIEVVVPFAPGGPSDVTARAMAGVAPEYLGVPVVIRNLPGAGGLVGFAHVAGAQPDGYQLLWANPATCDHCFTNGARLQDVVPIAQMIEREEVLLVGAESQHDTVEEFIQHASQHPDDVVIAYSSEVDRNPARALELLTGVGFRYVPFGAGRTVVHAVASGEADAFHAPMSAALPRIVEGELKALAITGVERDPNLPDVPTYQELGLEVYTLNNLGLMAPAGTPPEVVAKLESAMHAVSEDVKYLEVLAQLGETPVFLGTEAYQAKLERLEAQQEFRRRVPDAANGGDVDPRPSEEPTSEQPNGVVRASRMFVGPQQFPPEEFAAYGIVAFRSRAVTMESRDRFMNACKAYLGTLDLPSDLFVPVREQMVTVWPVEAEDLARELNADRGTPASICGRAIERYHLTTSRQAVEHARQTVEKEEDRPAVLNGRGPILLAWRPPSKKGERDALVLAADLSDLLHEEEFIEAFVKWRSDVESSPEFWPPLVGEEPEQSYLDRVRVWADTWGPVLIFVVGRRD